MNIDMAGEARAWELLREIADGYQKIMGDQLVGIYAHGSLAFGCFRWAVSDIDFIVVVGEEPTLQEKAAMIQILLDKLPDAPTKGYEMSVVLEKDCGLITHPVPYVLHYSNMHLERCCSDIERYCSEMHGTDPDLAAHFQVIRSVGRVVCGQPIDKVFSEVPREAYIASIWYDVEDAVQAADNPVYMALNLCRVLAAVEEEKILSKQQGGQWGLDRLPEKWRPLIETALDAYEGRSEADIEPAQAAEFGQYMLRRIQKNM